MHFAHWYNQQELLSTRLFWFLSGTQASITESTLTAVKTHMLIAMVKTCGTRKQLEGPSPNGFSLSTVGEVFFLYIYSLILSAAVYMGDPSF